MTKTQFEELLREHAKEFYEAGMVCEPMGTDRGHDIERQLLNWFPADPKERHRGDEVDPRRAQEAWYHVGQLAITEPELPVQQAVQRVYALCSRTSHP